MKFVPFQITPLPEFVKIVVPKTPHVVPFVVLYAKVLVVPFPTATHIFTPVNGDTPLLVTEFPL